MYLYDQFIQLHDCLRICLLLPLSVAIMMYDLVQNKIKIENWIVYMIVYGCKQQRRVMEGRR
jgi:hypothetical protein